MIKRFLLLLLKLSLTCCNGKHSSTNYVAPLKGTEQPETELSSSSSSMLSWKTQLEAIDWELLMSPEDGAGSLYHAERHKRQAIEAVQACYQLYKLYYQKTAFWEGVAEESQGTHAMGNPFENDLQLKGALAAWPLLQALFVQKKQNYQDKRSFVITMREGLAPAEQPNLLHYLHEAGIALTDAETEIIDSIPKRKLQYKVSTKWMEHKSKKVRKETEVQPSQQLTEDESALHKFISKSHALETKLIPLLDELISRLAHGIGRVNTDFSPAYWKALLKNGMKAGLGEMIVEEQPDTARKRQKAWRNKLRSATIAIAQRNQAKVSSLLVKAQKQKPALVPPLTCLENWLEATLPAQLMFEKSA